MLGLTVKQLLAIIIPVVVIQEAIVIAALLNLKKREQSELQGGKALWLVLLIFSLISVPTGLIIAALYFTLARKPYVGD